jgi:hypothetical protein
MKSFKELRNLTEKKSLKKACWDGYEAVGMKEKDGRKVPNCVPIKEGKEDMACNKPTRSSKAGKKMMVKACEGGKEKLVHFGASGYGHNYSPAARKSFRARHKCGEKKSKLSAQYWACKKLWAGKKGSKKSCPPGRKCKY